MKQPLVSIGVPTYGRPAELKRLLTQLVNQSYKNIEVIVGENSHPDLAGFEIAKSFEELDSRFRAIRHNTNIGPGPNHDLLKDLASGDFFMWLGDDDEVDEDYVLECMNVIGDDDSVSLVGGVGHRHLEGKWWYDYLPFTTVGLSTAQRLDRVSSFAFTKHWAFEHYHYGIFRKSRARGVTSKFPKSVLLHFFHLAESGDIAHAQNAVMTKNTTQNEIENHNSNSWYRKVWVLTLLKGRGHDTLEQSTPMYFQMLRVVLLSKNLSYIEKIDLCSKITARFSKGPVYREAILYLPKFQNLTNFIRRLRGGLIRRFKRIFASQDR